MVSSFPDHSWLSVFYSDPSLPMCGYFVAASRRSEKYNACYMKKWKELLFIVQNWIK